MSNSDSASPFNIISDSQETCIHCISRDATSLEGAIEKAGASIRPEAVLSLFLDNNSLTSVSPFIGNFENLHSLSVSRNRLVQVDASIGKCQHLRRVTLDNNELSELPEEFGTLSEVSYIYLEGNSFNRWPRALESPAFASTLRVLDFSRNGLRTLPESIGSLHQLQWFNLALNHLTSLPESIGNLTQLQCLDLSGNSLTRLPDGLSGCTQMQDFRCQTNLLESLPESLVSWKRIRLAILNHNRLRSLPGALFVAWGSTLESLALGNNQLEELPREIGFLTHLKALGLIRNNLRQLPNEIGFLGRLATLNLGENSLTELPDTLRHCKKLSTLDAHANQLETIPMALSSMTSQLRCLSLQQNPIKYLPIHWKSFPGLISMDETNLNLLHENANFFKNFGNDQSASDGRLAGRGPLSLFHIASNLLLKTYGTAWLRKCGITTWLLDGNTASGDHMDSSSGLPFGGSPYPLHELSIWVPARMDEITAAEHPAAVRPFSNDLVGRPSHQGEVAEDSPASNDEFFYIKGSCSRDSHPQNSPGTCSNGGRSTVQTLSPISKTPDEKEFVRQVLNYLPRVILQRFSALHTCSECDAPFFHHPMELLEWSTSVSTPYHYLPFQHQVCSFRCFSRVRSRTIRAAASLLTNNVEEVSPIFSSNNFSEYSNEEQHFEGDGNSSEFLGDTGNSDLFSMMFAVGRRLSSNATSPGLRRVSNASSVIYPVVEESGEFLQLSRRAPRREAIPEEEEGSNQ